MSNEYIKQLYLANCLYDCIEDNDINAIRLLLENNKANPNIVIPEKGISPLHLIIGNPNEKTAEEVTNLFLRYGGDANVRSEDNMTPVHVAAAWGRKNILDLLLKCGGDINIQDDENKSALDYAKSENYTSIINLLQNFDDNLQETHNNDYDITFHKVIIENKDIIAEYNVEKPEYDSFNLVNNYLNQLPQNEIHSYVKNWCDKNVNVPNNKRNMYNKTRIGEEYVGKDTNFYLTDNFVTIRNKDRTFFSISTDNESKQSNDLCKSIRNGFENNQDKKMISISYELCDVVYIGNCNHDSNSINEIGKELNIENSETNNVIDKNIENELENCIIDTDESEITSNISNGSGIQFTNNIGINIDEISKSILEEEITNPLEKSFIISKDDLKLTQSTSNDSDIKLENNMEQTTNNSLTNSINKNIQEAPGEFCMITTDESELVGNTSRESGLHTIPSDLSYQVYSNPLNECQFKGTIDSLVSKSTNSYKTCKDFPSVNWHEINVFNSSLMTSDASEIEKINQSQLNETHIIRNINETYITSTIEKTNLHNPTGIPCQTSSNSIKNESLLNLAEEYKYTDKKDGVVLIERLYLISPVICIEDNKSSSSTVASSLPTTIDYDTDTLRKELMIRGEQAGPITSSTKRVYLKRLMRMQRTTEETYNTYREEEDCSRIYSIELEKTLRSKNWAEDLTPYKELESALIKQFSQPDPSKKWREGISKASFTYLLMDSRITKNLPARAEHLLSEEIWKTFLTSVFYVGKGKRSRPYSHLNEAILHWNNTTQKKANKKIKHILEIWQEGKGVVCLHIFQNVIPVEAYTREAAIISAMKLDNLKNSKSGDFYGVAATWPQRQKRQLGVYLLWRAMFIFLNEGERQLRPDDI